MRKFHNYHKVCSILKAILYTLFVLSSLILVFCFRNRISPINLFVLFASLMLVTYSFVMEVVVNLLKKKYTLGWRGGKYFLIVIQSLLRLTCGLALSSLILSLTLLVKGSSLFSIPKHFEVEKLLTEDVSSQMVRLEECKVVVKLDDSMVRLQDGFGLKGTYYLLSFKTEKHTKCQYFLAWTEETQSHYIDELIHQHNSHLEDYYTISGYLRANNEEETNMISGLLNSNNELNQFKETYVPYSVVYIYSSESPRYSVFRPLDCFICSLVVTILLIAIAIQLGKFTILVNNHTLKGKT